MQLVNKLQIPHGMDGMAIKGNHNRESVFSTVVDDEKMDIKKKFITNKQQVVVINCNGL